MTTTPFQEQITAAIEVIDGVVKDSGATRAEEMARRARPIILWIHWLRAHRPSQTASELLPGVEATILESIAYIGMGLGRACLTAIRLEIDLLLGYIYFKDHPVEWHKVVQTGEGFMLRGDIYSYCKSIDKCFQGRLALIETKSSISLERLYKTLSAHIHGQSPLTMPNTQTIVELVWEEPKISSVLDLQETVAQALSHFLLSVFAREWTDLPADLISEARTILGTKHQEFFAN